MLASVTNSAIILKNGMLLIHWKNAVRRRIVSTSMLVHEIQ